MSDINDEAAEPRNESAPGASGPAAASSSGMEGTEEEGGVAVADAGETSPEEQVQALTGKVEEWRAAYLRAMADMDNLRKRTTREVESARKYALEVFAKDLLLVADNLDRALGALDGAQGVEEISASSVKGLMEGVTLVRSELLRIFNKHGVTRIEALNQPFDPNQHQAMVQVAREGVDAGVVVQEFQAGYLLNQRLLRPSLVAVTQ
ncbi:MAG: nucleotide exchange factor GrpE [Magnetococcales bacterium]|nr:nucleotide exchange factor GrpE [Magnetococcales bacterium]